METPTSDSESEIDVLGYDGELDDEHYYVSSPGKKFRKTLKRERDRDGIGRDAGSSGRDHRHFPYERRRVDRDEEIDRDHGNLEARCIKEESEYHQGQDRFPKTSSTPGKCFNIAYPGDNLSRQTARIRGRDDLLSRSDRAGTSTQEGAVTFRPMKKLHRHHRKRPLSKMKCHDQERMATYKNSHQHSTPSDLALYRETNNLLTSGLLPALNININAVFQTPYKGRDGSPVKRRKMTSLSSDSEAVSDNEVHEEPLPIDERRTKTKSLSKSSEVITIPDSSPDDDSDDLRTKHPPKMSSSYPEIICISSDSDHQDMTSPVRPTRVDTLISISDDQDVDDETFVSEISDQNNDLVDDDDDDDAASDSSDLPECPVLEVMSDRKPKIFCRDPYRSTESSSYNALPSYNAPPLPLFKKEEEEIETIEPECVRIEPVVSPRSRHSSGDLEGREEEEEAMDTCWGAFLLASGDTKASDLSVRKYQHQSGSRSFNCDKRNAVYACSEEEFTAAAVNLIAKFTTTVHKPPPQLLQELYHDTLRERSSNSYSESSIVYRCLKSIQHLHHPSCRDFPIEWNHMKELATSLVNTPLDGEDTKWHTNLLSFSYLVSILEDDVERKSRWDTLKKSFAFSILNPETCRNNCREVVEWILRLVCDLESTHGISCGCPDGACHRNYVLPMLGKLLELSFRMTNNWTLKSYLQRTVEELNSSGLKGLPQIRLLLETLQQPWLRLKLCNLLFNSRFESEIFGISRENVSVSRIVQEYFLYLPKPTPVNNNDGEEEMMKSRFTSSSRELMVYLLLVMLQSYLKCCSGCPSKDEQGKKSSSLSKSSALWSSLYRKQLSDDDRICLLQMGDYVDQLRNHLRSSSSSSKHHPVEMSMVTEVCLAQMSVLYEWM